MNQRQSHYYSQQNLWDKTWKDNKGRVAIWQTPNIWLIGWAVLTTISIIITGRMADIFAIAGSAALIIWSLLEIFRGTNYFRRALGAFVLLFAITVVLKSL